jgi:regulator of protease activity HflC (stomatin/prohibitin superfamily)
MEKKTLQYEEKIRRGGNLGVPLLILAIILLIICVPMLVIGITKISYAYYYSDLYAGITLIILSIIAPIIGVVLLCGLKVVRPNEALVLTLFGKYYATLKGEGFYFVNPFCTAVNPTMDSSVDQAAASPSASSGSKSTSAPTHRKKADSSAGKRISLKEITLNNGKQKINDELGNPIEIGIVVIWRVVNTAKAVFNVDNYMEFLSIQADSALRNIVRLYPYDVSDGGDEKSLRGSSQEVAERLKTELQDKVNVAGLEIVEARITHLAYAPEIAAAMLQRQQASAIIDARKMIVDGAVGMVEMALTKLSENNVVQLDDERKAAMVSNLLVVLCGNKDAQPVVNSGSIY